MVGESGKISGVILATARGTFMYDKEGKGYYNFLDYDAFQWKLPQVSIMDMGIEFQDLYDCCEQAVVELGDPEEYRVKMGLEPNIGYSNLGITFRSNTDERILCVFTPTSNEYGEWDCYFEWYLQDKPEEETVSEFIKNFEELSGFKPKEESKEVIPGYREASELLEDVSIPERSKNVFLEKLYKFHNSTSRGYRFTLKDEVLHEWKELKRKISLVENENDSKLVLFAKYLGRKFDGEVPVLPDDSRAICSLKSTSGIPFDCELDVSKDGKLKYVLKRDSDIVDEFEFDGLTKSSALVIAKMISDQLFMADALNGKTEGKIIKAFSVANKLLEKGTPLEEAVSSVAIKYDLSEENEQHVCSLLEVKSKKKR